MTSQNRRRLVAGLGTAFAAAATGTMSYAVRAAMGPDDKFDLVIKGGVPFGRPYQSPFSVR